MIVNVSVYATLVCKQSCNYLGINCFTIPYPPPNKTTTTETTTKTTSVVAEASSDESMEENDKTL